MSLATGLASQLAHPHGMGGQLLGKAMDWANRRVTQRAVKLLGPRDGECILDAGCGTGAALMQVRQHADCQLVGLDPSPTMLGMARQALGSGASLHCGAIEDRILPSGRFDAVLALNVLYFADADGAMARALFELLKPGGRLVAYVTERETMERWSFTRAGLHRLYDVGEFDDLLTEAGFAPDPIEIHRERVAIGVTGLFAYATR